jgi:hypothetical protein
MRIAEMTADTISNSMRARPEFLGLPARMVVAASSFFRAAMQNPAPKIRITRQQSCLSLLHSHLVLKKRTESLSGVESLMSNCESNSVPVF